MFTRARIFLSNLADLVFAIVLGLLILVFAAICGIVQVGLALLDLLLRAAMLATEIAAESWKDRRR